MTKMPCFGREKSAIRKGSPMNACNLLPKVTVSLLMILATLSFAGCDEDNEYSSYYGNVSGFFSFSVPAYFDTGCGSCSYDDQSYVDPGYYSDGSDSSYGDYGYYSDGGGKLK